MKKKCVICDKGAMVKRQVEYKDVGISLGRFQAEVCTSCGEAVFSEETAKKIETLEKKLGIFGLEEKAKVRKSGNSLTLTITTKIEGFEKLPFSHSKPHQNPLEGFDGHTRWGYSKPSIAKFLGLKEGTEVVLKPADRKTLMVIEPS